MTAEAYGNFVKSTTNNWVIFESTPTGAKFLSEGSGGLTRLREAVDNKKIQFAILKVNGWDGKEGHSPRIKLAGIYFLGKAVSQAQKRTLLSFKPEVQSTFLGLAASFEADGTAIEATEIATKLFTQAADDSVSYDFGDGTKLTQGSSSSAGKKKEKKKAVHIVPKNDEEKAALLIQRVSRRLLARRKLEQAKTHKQKLGALYWDLVIQSTKDLKATEASSSSSRKTALLIIDVQNDFLPPKGSLAVAKGDQVIPVINSLREKVNFDMVVLSQDYHPKGHVSFQATFNDKGAVLFQPFQYAPGKYQMMWPTHCVEGTDGAKFHPELKIAKTDIVVQKGKQKMVDSYSAFYDNDHKSATELSGLLKKGGITDVFVVGIAYDYCVGYSALDAVGEGFRTFVVDEGCRGVDPVTIKKMKKKLRKAGVSIVRAEDVHSDGSVTERKKEDKKEEKVGTEEKAARKIQKVYREKRAKKILKKSQLAKSKLAADYWHLVLKDLPVTKKVAPSAAARKSALLIIDVQYDFLPPDGSLAVKNGTDVIPVINALRNRVKFHHVALTQDWHPVGHVSFCSTHSEKGACCFAPFRLNNGSTQMMWPDHCIQGTPGADFHKDLIIKRSDVIIRKGINLHVDSYSGFFDNDHKSHTELSATLKKFGVTDVYVTGIAYDYCVGYSALDALSEGFRTYVVEDACRGVAPETILHMKRRLKTTGVKIIDSKDIPTTSLMPIETTLEIKKKPKAEDIALAAAIRIQKNYRKWKARKNFNEKKKARKTDARSYWELVMKDAKAAAAPAAALTTKRKSALIIIDVQNDFLPPAGSLAVAKGTDVIPIINKLRNKIKFDHVALTQDWHPVKHVSFCSTFAHQGAKLFSPFTLKNGKVQMMWPDHCLQNSHGADFHKDLVVKHTDSVVRKGTLEHIDSYSGFFDNDHCTKSELSPILKKLGITDVYVTGIAYDYCVGYSALDARTEGFRTFLIEDACRGVAPETIDAMKAKLKDAEVGIITSSDVPTSGIIEG